MGITSTYVENTLKIPAEVSVDQDHLHIRGEYFLLSFVKMMFKGSPPHTWRILKIGAKADLSSGITSTYVENTSSSLTIKAFFRDHLHIRGEYPSSWGILSLGLGSPPHTWRILKPRLKNWCIVRITSTYVENTVSLSGT